MADQFIDTLKNGDWKPMQVTNGLSGFALLRDGIKAAVIPSEQGEYQWGWHIENSMSGVADTSDEAKQEVDDIIEMLTKHNKKFM